MFRLRSLYSCVLAGVTDGLFCDTAFAQAPGSREILVGAQLTSPLNLGINTSGNLANWLTTDSSCNCLNMIYPAGQAWGAIFITVGQPVDPPRPFIDLSAF